MAKLVECRTCKKEVAKGAKVCPHCGEINPTVTMKDTIGGVAFLVIMVVVLLSFSKDNAEANTDNKIEVATKVKTVKWYQKGMLSQSKVTDWKGATAEIKLATSANLLLTLSKRIKAKVKQSGSIDEAKPFATELVTCIDKTVADLDKYKTVAGPDTVYKSKMLTESDTKLFNVAVHCMIVLDYLK